ncbi:MAG: hypothetical protein E7500_05850 [Ruminococcus sp.]|nr:hypothetical protein [Ruminococcus sp.]
MEKYNEFAGIVSEKELDSMITEDTAVGGVSTYVCVTVPLTIVTVAQITFGWDFCPTCACTDSCRF